MNLRKKVFEAEEIVSGLEEPLKSEAYKIILKKLLSEKEKNSIVPRNKISKNAKLMQKEESIDKLCSEINRTSYPKMYKLTRALDLSLYVLKISNEGFKIEGLSPSQISKILNEVFRLKITPAAVNMALGNALTYVDRKPIIVQGGKSYRYILMHAGEECINAILNKLEDD